MKTKNSRLLILLPVLAFAFLLLTAFGSMNSNTIGAITPEETIVIPEDVQGYLTNHVLDVTMWNPVMIKARKN